MTNLNEMIQTGCFVSVHVSRPTLRTSLSWRDLGLPELDENLVTPPSTRPPSASYNVFSRLESRMRTILRQHSAGSKGGFRFVKFALMRPLLDAIEVPRQEYLDAVGPFLEGYEASVEAALVLWRDKAGEIYDSLKPSSVADVTRDEFAERIETRLRRAWPTQEALRKRFDARVEVLQFTMPSADVFGLDVDLMAQARTQAATTLHVFFEEAQNELRSRALEVLQRMRDVIVEGKVTERTVNPLREFVTQFRALSVVPDDAFQRLLDDLVRTIDHNDGASGLRNNAAFREGMAGILEEISREGERLIQDSQAVVALDLSNRTFRV